MTGVRMELKGSEEALGILSETISRTEDAKGLFDAIGMALVTSTQKRFEDEAGPDGNPWPDSLRKTLLGGRTLTETARLVQSITHEASDARVAVGTNVIYAAIHQVGGTIKAKTEKGLRFRSPGNGGWVRRNEVTMPARPFLGLDEEDRQEITAICAEWLGAVEDGAPDARR
jgi:phage virion morphogenesis protein